MNRGASSWPVVSLEQVSWIDLEYRRITDLSSIEKCHGSIRQIKDLPHHHPTYAYRHQSYVLVGSVTSVQEWRWGGEESVGGDDEDICRWWRCEGVLGREWVEYRQDLAGQSHLLTDATVAFRTTNRDWIKLT